MAFNRNSSVHGPVRPRSSLFAFTALVGACLFLANCSSVSDSKLGVKPSPRVVAEGKPVPKGGGRNQLGKPYTVGGKTYTPMEEPGYKREGVASWYGSEFHGRLTSNGEVYDNSSLSAAHPTMPLPSYARVTNKATGASVVVRVNDRGPFHSDRLIDVSRKTAELLGFRRAGSAQVEVEYIGRASLNGSDDSKLLTTYRTTRNDLTQTAALRLNTDAQPSPAPQTQTPKPAAAAVLPPPPAPTPVEVAPAPSPAPKPPGGMGGPYISEAPAPQPAANDMLMPPPEAAPAAAEMLSQSDDSSSNTVEPSPAARIASAVPVSIEPMPLMAPSLMSSQGQGLVAPSLNDKAFHTR